MLYSKYQYIQISIGLSLQLIQYFFSEVCVAVHFINKAGIPFEIKTDLSDEPYLIKQGNLRFKDVVKKPELHRLVIFRASDPMNKYKVLLSGGSEITVTPSPNCDDEIHYLEVLVTSKPGMIIKARYLAISNVQEVKTNILHFENMKLEHCYQLKTRVIFNVNL